MSSSSLSAFRITSLAEEYRPLETSSRMNDSQCLPGESDVIAMVRYFGCVIQSEFYIGIFSEIEIAPMSIPTAKMNRPVYSGVVHYF
ncbi:MAG: hypothetical protein AB8B96_05135 [Lysobacterales bacterium]